ncbi:unnamed protein product, partial [Prorocentrum cordatum]
LIANSTQESVRGVPPEALERPSHDLPFMEMLRGIWSPAPAVTRSIAVLPLVFHFFALVGYSSYLEVVLDLSLAGVKQGRVTGILLSCLWAPPAGLLSSLFALFLAYGVLNSVAGMERALGSGRLILWVVSSTVAVNLLFLLLAFALDALSPLVGLPPIWARVPCHGLVVLAVLSITASKMMNPEVQTLFFGLIPMKNKYYPLALVAFFVLLSGPMALGDVAAVAVGYLHKRLGLQGELLSEHTLTRLESSRFACICGRGLFGGRWVPVRESVGGTGLDGGAPVLPTTSAGGGGYTLIG